MTKSLITNFQALSKSLEMILKRLSQTFLLKYHTIRYIFRVLWRTWGNIAIRIEELKTRKNKSGWACFASCGMRSNHGASQGSILCSSGEVWSGPECEGADGGKKVSLTKQQLKFGRRRIYWSYWFSFSVSGRDRATETTKGGRSPLQVASYLPQISESLQLQICASKIISVILK